MEPEYLLKQVAYGTATICSNKYLLDYLKYMGQMYNLDRINQILVFLQTKGNTRGIASANAWKAIGREIVPDADFIYGVRPVIGSINTSDNNTYEKYGIEYKIIQFYKLEDTKGDKKIYEDIGYPININIEEKLIHALNTRETTCHILEYPMNSSDFPMIDSDACGNYTIGIPMSHGPKRDRALLMALVSYVISTAHSSEWASDFTDTITDACLYALENRYDIETDIGIENFGIVAQFDDKYRQHFFEIIQHVLQICISILEEETLDFTQTMLLKQISTQNEIIQAAEENDMQKIIDILVFIHSDETDIYKKKLLDILDVLIRLNEPERHELLVKMKQNQINTYPPYKLAKNIESLAISFSDMCQL